MKRCTRSLIAVQALAILGCGGMEPAGDEVEPGDEGIDAAAMDEGGAADAGGPDLPGPGDVPKVLRSCPSQMPPWDEWPACEGTWSSCYLGQECCCGECDFRSSCQCFGGSFECYAVDFCEGASCSPGCPNQHYTTPLGCLTCVAIGGEIMPHLEEAASELAVGCQQAEDCVATDSHLGYCGTCSYAILSQRLDEYAAYGVALASDWCSFPGVSACAAPTCAEGVPACVDGVCKLVPEPAG